MAYSAEKWAEFFRDFRPIFDILPAAQSNSLTNYIISEFNLSPGRTFLDCPCGPGRISLRLARKGVKVTGVDFMPSYLAELQQKAERRKLKVKTFCADMRRIDFKNQFDAAGNLWTSIGYFEKESDNLLVIKKVFAALKPGGKFLVHTINRDWLILNFQSSDWQQFKNSRLLETRTFDYATSVIDANWTFLHENRTVEHSIRIRVYSYHELRAMFEKAGFVNIDGYSSHKNEPVDRKARMLFVIGTKPRR